jgi:hypothetical protein
MLGHVCFSRLRTTYLDALCNDLWLCELCVMNARVELLPQVQRRHLHGISGCNKEAGESIDRSYVPPSTTMLKEGIMKMCE